MAIARNIYRLSTILVFLPSMTAVRRKTIGGDATKMFEPICLDGRKEEVPLSAIIGCETFRERRSLWIHQRWRKESRRIIDES